MNEADIENLRKLLTDRTWRLNNLYWIEDAFGRIVRFRLNWAQKQIHECIDTLKHGRINVLKVRQLGISTYAGILMLDLCLFGRNKHCGINDKDIDGAMDKLQRVLSSYEYLDYLPDDPSDFDRGMAEVGAEIKAAKKLMVKNAKILKWNNGCWIKAGTNLRGGTLQFLHVSELAYVAANDPRKAKKIVTGSMNTVHVGDSLIILESTHEGGKTGISYELTKQAMEMQGHELSAMDYRFFFFSWVDHPEYRLPGHAPRLNKELEEYFAGLEAQGVHVDDDQKAWYAGQYRQNGFYVRQEFPTTPEEAFEMPIEGAIYGRVISALRAKGRTSQDFEMDPLKPLYVTWDLGMGDATSMWLLQPVDRLVYALDHYQASGVGLDHYINVVRQWEAKYKVIYSHLLPHDADNRNLQTGVTTRDFFTKAGIRNVSIVKRTPDVWAGINALRMMLPNFVFHRRCNDGITFDGVDYVSGLSALENYHTRDNGQICHDVYSHSADSLRYFAEGFEQGLIAPYEEVTRAKPKAPRFGPGALRNKWR